MKNFANHIGYSDINPFEVVRAVSKTTLEIRAMNAERDTSVKLDFQPGGFFAHCSNQNEQRWDITPNEEARVFRIRFSKAKNRWQDSFGNRYNLANKPTKFYDYNF